jgi:hypothetical protein
MLLTMARKTNYAFERNARAKAKAEKREAKRQAKLASRTDSRTDDAGGERVSESSDSAQGAGS